MIPWRTLEYLEQLGTIGSKMVAFIRKFDEQQTLQEEYGMAIWLTALKQIIPNNLRLHSIRYLM
jgi:hypothetical protein